MNISYQTIFLAHSEPLSDSFFIERDVNVYQMARVIHNVLNFKKPPLSQFISTKTSIKLPYEIPERYQNAFYLANASFYDSTNWFLHRAYEVVFPKLKSELLKVDSYKNQTTDRATEKIEEIIKILDQCNSIIDVRFPVKRDNGLQEIIRGFRAQHGLSAGYSSCLGGLRIHENITRDHMKGLAVLSTYRNACMGINMAGAHGGIKICPKNYSPDELQRIVELYCTELIKKGYRQSLNMASAGKSSDYGGIENHEQMSSQGALYAINFFLNNEQIMNKVGLTTGIQGKTFIIQGLGKLGAPLAELLVNGGAICVGVKEQDAYLYDAKGINLKELYEYKAKNGSIVDYSMTKPYENDSIYTEECDILVFAAYHKSLVCHIAKDVKAKVVVEAADGPLTPTSHRILTGKSKLVIPDIYACSGATVASYLEYLRNMQQMRVGDLLRFSRNVYENILNRLSEKHDKVAAAGGSVQILSSQDDPKIITESIESILTDTGNEILRLLEHHKLGTDARTAAYMIGIENIFKAIYYQKIII
ncbi:glutamate dehydrogenase, mitochondrial-like [Anoplophora glabripennis]|uniref:glutamate dehydrogenase, mitochondrial-like n=1 Tax=Anoplophora glabripennis TaxID=217634 RepID=UPI000874C9D8|nr:glutamate dehydrogenase, mitochondrial-like [Anoplophora glabripennis]